MIYADNAATTKMSPVALAAMLPALEDNYGNPSSLHSVGQHAAELLQSAREAMARCLNCKPREILFTSGGSEADNQALLSGAMLWKKKGKISYILKECNCIQMEKPCTMAMMSRYDFPN